MTSIRRRNTRRLTLQNTITARALFTAVSVASALPAQGAPSGGVVTAGAGAISQQDTTTTITQSATQAQQPARMVIDWNSFSSAAGESIVFNQPNAAAVALNRVTGASPSQLMGSLSANGQVFILNPNGVLFGPGSQVNVRGLLASTLNMDNASFMAGSHVLQGGSGARVINQGSLKAADGGYVALIGPGVVNDGLISPTGGNAVLAAGDKVTVRLEGGSLIGYSMDLGSVNALVDNTANGAISATGGRVTLEARAANALSKAVVNHAGLIEARTLENSTGSIRLIGDREVGQIQVSGRLDASAPNGGSGGFIETSAARVRIDDSTRITTNAPSGVLGTVLIESNAFEIAPAIGERSDSSISAATLASVLGDAKVSIKSSASAGGTGSGDINVNADVAWSGPILTLAADRNINLNASLRANRIGLLYGQASLDGGTADFYLYNGATIDLPPISRLPDGIFFTQKGNNLINRKNYQVISSPGDGSAVDALNRLQDISSRLSGTDHYALGSNITATATRSWNSGAGFIPLAELNGTFDGLGHTINGLFVDSKGNETGLFSRTSETGQVRNLGLIDADIRGAQTVGALTGFNQGSITNSHVTGSVSGILRTGGLAGASTGSISGSYSQAAVEGVEVTGGLVGEIRAGSVSDSYASGAVSPLPVVNPNGPPIEYTFTGGLVGFNRGMIAGSYSSAGVSGGKGVGGLVGQNSGSIENSYASGNVAGQTWVGGLAGFQEAGSSIKNAYATGSVRGDEAGTTGGLVGASASTATVTSGWWNTETTGQTNSAGGEGRTSAQLRQAATFTGWDIATTGGTEKVWRIYEGKGMPLLRSFLAPLVLGPSDNVIAQYTGEVQKSPAIPASGMRTATAASGRNVGTYQPYSNQQGYDLSNGELVITPKPLTFTPVIASKAYDGTVTAFATLADNRVDGDKLTILYGANFIDKNAGIDKAATVSIAELSGDDAGNYSYDRQIASTGNITARPLTITVTAADKVYDGNTTANAAFSAVPLGRDELSFAYSGAAFDDKNVGTNKNVTVSGFTLGGADAGNYAALLQAGTTASITPRPLAITATAAGKVYDGTTSALPLLQDNRIPGDALVTSAVASFDDKNAATGKNVTVSGIAVAGADAGNYLYQPEVTTTTADITPRALNLRATAADKAYDGTTQASVMLSDDRVAGDAITASYQRAEFADKNGGEQKSVTVSGIRVAGADAPNYQADTSTTARASIRPLSLTVTANPDARLADGVPYRGGNGVTYTGFIEGETDAVLDGQLRYGGSAQGAMREGSYRISPGGLSSLNYAARFVDGTLTMQPLPPGAGIVAAYTQPAVSVHSSPGGSEGGSPLRITDCGMRMPENVLLGGC